MKRVLACILAAGMAIMATACHSDVSASSSDPVSGQVSSEISSEDTSSLDGTSSAVSDVSSYNSTPSQPGSTSSKSGGSSSSKPGSTPAKSGSSPTVKSNGGTTSKPSASSQALQTVRVTLTEGMTLPKMFGILEDKKVASEDALFKAAANDDFSQYSLVNGIKMSSARCYRLEGYLFPDTYEFYVGESPDSIIDKMLANTQKRITQDYKTRASAIGMTMDQVINLASIIEKEAGRASEMPNVSSVLHNRLKSGMKLQCDSTITYVEYVIKPFITGDLNRFNSYYNTYKCSALPAGPICNPGKNAIEAALWPADTDYYYFAIDKSGNYYYAETYEEHVQNCKDAGIAVS